MHNGGFMHNVCYHGAPVTPRTLRMQTLWLLAAPDKPCRWLHHIQLLRPGRDQHHQQHPLQLEHGEEHPAKPVRRRTHSLSRTLGAHHGLRQQL